MFSEVIVFNYVPEQTTTNNNDKKKTENKKCFSRLLLLHLGFAIMLYLGRATYT